MWSSFSRAGLFLSLTVVTCIVTVYLAKKSSGSSTIKQKSRKKNKTLHETIPDPEQQRLLLKEQLSRTEQFIGEEGLRKLRSARVCVIGLGGVGSHCAHLLARSGVGKLRLVDFDRVTLSSLNRHALAVRTDVGEWKCTVLAERLQEIMGEDGLEVEPIVALCNAQNVEQLVQGCNFVIDCIDDQTTKIDLLETCHRLDVPIMSSLAAGGKVDPTRLKIAKMSDTTYDPLAARLRARIVLERRKIDLDKIEVVYSSEEPKARLLGLNQEQQETPQEFGAMPHFRLRIMPVLGTSPALFGIAIASRVITKIAESCEFTPFPVDIVSKNMIHSAYQRLTNYEVKIFGRGPVTFTEEDAQFLAVLFRKRCIFTGAKMGAHGTKLDLARWYPDRAVDINNAILAERHIVEAIYSFHAKKTGLPPTAEDINVDSRLIETVEAFLVADKTTDHAV
jgi:tRNA A37 threonylcarbamoyladenosine dehydratase